MNEINNELLQIFHQIEKIKKNQKLSIQSSIIELKKLCDLSDHMCMILDIEENSIIYINNKASDNLTLKFNKDSLISIYYLFKIIHPESINAIKVFITHFTNNKTNKLTLPYAYYIQTKKEWEWMYAYFKAIFTKNNKVKYILGIGCNIEQLIENRNRLKIQNKNLDFIEKNISKYNKLSKREIEILNLISDEYTSIEISKILHITPFTVDTHRKNLIKKLDVKSSLGLVKYANLF